MERKKTTSNSFWLLIPAIFLILAGTLWQLKIQLDSSKFLNRKVLNLDYKNKILHLDPNFNKSFYILKSETSFVPIDNFDNLNLVDRILLKKFLWGINLVDLKTYVIKDLELGDVSLAEKDITDEKLRVEILNANGPVGLANTAANILTNIGIDIVNIGNSDKQTNACQIYTEDLNFKTVKRINKFLKCEIFKKTAGERAQVTILLRSLRLDE